MSDLVQILHGAPVHHLPTRSRDARTAYAPMVTGVRLRELSKADTDDGPALPVNGDHVLATRMVDGTIFRPIGCNDAFATGRQVAKAPTGAEFKAWLEGHEYSRGLDESDAARCLEGTPVLVRTPGQRTPFRPYAPWNQAKEGKVLLDTRPDAPAAVESYAWRNLALVDGKPFMRMRGPILFYDTGMDRVRILRHPGAWTTNHSVNTANPFRIDRLEELLAFENLKPKGNPDLVTFGKDLVDGIAFDEDDDIDMFVQDAMRILSTPLTRWHGGPPYEPARRDQVVRLSALGSAGMIPREEHADICRLIAGLDADLRVLGAGWLPDAGKRLARYAEAVALPRIHASIEVDVDDVESLGALAR